MSLLPSAPLTLIVPLLADGCASAGCCCKHHDLSRVLRFKGWKEREAACCSPWQLSQAVRARACGSAGQPSSLPLGSAGQIHFDRCSRQLLTFLEVAPG